MGKEDFRGAIRKGVDFVVHPLTRALTLRKDRHTRDSQTRRRKIWEHASPEEKSAIKARDEDRTIHLDLTDTKLDDEIVLGEPYDPDLPTAIFEDQSETIVESSPLEIDTSSDISTEEFQQLKGISTRGKGELPPGFSIADDLSDQVLADGDDLYGSED